MQAEVADPRPSQLLQVAVQSATRNGERITAVLTGTYRGDRITLSTGTTVKASRGSGRGR